MSACNTFTEHVWKPGECKNCFKPKSLHCLNEGGPRKGPPDQKQQDFPPAGTKTNANLANSSQRSSSSARSGHFRPPVAKKPTIAVKPTMMLPCSSVGLDLEGNHRPADGTETGKTSAFTVWNHNGLNQKTASGPNNNEGEDCDQMKGYVQIGHHVASSSSNNNGLTDVLKEIAGLGSGLPAAGCLGMGSSGNAAKRVSLSDSTEIISTEGGRFCYPEFSSDGEDDEDDEYDESERDDEHESWDESDEELLAMEIRMRGQPRFANFRAATLSPVPFAAGKKWNTVPLRNRSLQRICAVDYDDSYDEILNGYPSVDANGDHSLLPYRKNELQGSGFLSKSESATSPESSSSMPEDSHTSSSSSSTPFGNHNGLYSPSATREPLLRSDVPDKEFPHRALSSPKATETHKAVLAIRLEDQDACHKEGGALPQALPGQPITISFSPTEEQAKPYRVVNLDKPLICKPYTVVDVSASMASTDEYTPDNTPKPKGLSTPSTSNSSVTSSSHKKPGNIRYQEVWTSSTSPRQKIPKVELVSGGASGPSVPPRICSHKSAPTSPISGLSSSRTVPVKSPNLSEIKFNSYNNAGMPPFPIIIRDEPTYARSCKNAVKVPIVINPSAYDNLAVYKSFLGVGGELPQPKPGVGGRVTSHTYEEIGSSESVQPPPSEKAENSKLTGDTATSEDSKTCLAFAMKSYELNNRTTMDPNIAPSVTLVSPVSPSFAPSPHSAGISNENNNEVVQSATGTGHREKASTVLSQIVASIQPPQSPPESPSTQGKACSSEELYAVPPDAAKQTLSRPKSLFSSTDGCLSRSRKETPTKQLPKSQSASAAVAPTSPKSDSGAPFPPPRSTSSPYHASNLLQRHFSNWTKPSPGSCKPSDGETSPVGGDSRRSASENAKPKRWISFKSFFRRRKDEDEQRERLEREKEKGKLVGLDGTVITMLPPPPSQRRHWFAEAKTDDPSQKPTIIFTYKPDSSAMSDGEGELRVEESAETGERSRPLSPGQSAPHSRASLLISKVMRYFFQTEFP
uniref:Pseudopodium-enriched atypical kinase 1 n=1 Tax=Denticeps clupeoides TaxID=299321 RepID=A0AAY4CK66_9TELE